VLAIAFALLGTWMWIQAETEVRREEREEWHAEYRADFLAPLAAFCRHMDTAWERWRVGHDRPQDQRGWQELASAAEIEDCIEHVQSTSGKELLHLAESVYGKETATGHLGGLLMLDDFNHFHEDIRRPMATYLCDTVRRRRERDKAFRRWVDDVLLGELREHRPIVVMLVYLAYFVRKKKTHPGDPCAGRFFHWCQEIVT